MSSLSRSSNVIDIPSRRLRYTTCPSTVISHYIIYTYSGPLMLPRATLKAFKTTKLHSNGFKLSLLDCNRLRCTIPLQTALRFSSSSSSTASRPPLRLSSFRPSIPRFLPATTARTLTTTTHSQANTAAESFPDPDRPDLFYHLFLPPTSLSSTTPVFALSFLPDPPPSLLSASVIGWLPASGEGDGAGLNDFVENGASPRLPPHP